MDLRPYEVFTDLKLKHTAVKIDIPTTEIELHATTFPTLEEYVRFAFKRDGYQVDRYRHDYDSLNTPNPKLGLVFLADDHATLNPTIEVWALIGHNITTAERIQSDGTNKSTLIL